MSDSQDQRRRKVTLVLDRSYQTEEGRIVDVYRHPEEGWEREQYIDTAEWLDEIGE